MYKQTTASLRAEYRDYYNRLIAVPCQDNIEKEEKENGCTINDEVQPELF